VLKASIQASIYKKVIYFIMPGISQGAQKQRKQFQKGAGVGSST
jgi:hypothetical protein